MIDQKRRKELEALGFRVSQFDVNGNVMGMYKKQIADPNHFAADLYPHGKNDVYWSWPEFVPATEEECWAAIEQAVANNEIDFDKFNGRQ